MSESFEHIPPHDPDVDAVQTYLATGKISPRLAWSALVSVVKDPWFSWLSVMTGPLGYALRRLYYARVLARVGAGVLIDVGVTLHGGRRIALGDFCWIDSYTKLIAPYGRISVGKRVHVATGAVLLGAGTISIGDYAGIAPYALILSSTEHPVPGRRMSGPMLPLEQRGLRQAPVVVGNDAFVGAHAVVMPGVTIGEGAVVSAHAVVTKDVAPYEIVFGAPARRIGRRAPVSQPDLRP